MAEGPPLLPVVSLSAIIPNTESCSSASPVCHTRNRCYSPSIAFFDATTDPIPHHPQQSSTLPEYPALPRHTHRTSHAKSEEAAGRIGCGACSRGEAVPRLDCGGLPAGSRVSASGLSRSGREKPRAIIAAVRQTTAATTAYTGAKLGQKPAAELARAPANEVHAHRMIAKRRKQETAQRAGEKTESFYPREAQSTHAEEQPNCIPQKTPSPALSTGETAPAWLRFLPVRDGIWGSHQRTALSIEAPSELCVTAPGVYAAPARSTASSNARVEALHAAGELSSTGVDGASGAGECATSAARGLTTSAAPGAGTPTTATLSDVVAAVSTTIANVHGSDATVAGSASNAVFTVANVLVREAAVSDSCPAATTPKDVYVCGPIPSAGVGAHRYGPPHKEGCIYGHAAASCAGVGYRNSHTTARHSEPSECGVGKDCNVADCTNFPAVHEQDNTADSGDFTGVKSPHRTADPASLLKKSRNVELLLGRAAPLQKKGSARTKTQSACAGARCLDGEQESREAKEKTTNSEEHCSSNSDGSADSGHRYECSKIPDSNSSTEKSSTFLHTTSSGGSSKHSSDDDSSNVGRSMILSELQEDSCRSTSVSTRSSAATPTSRSVDSGPLETESVCCSLNDYNGCDLCSDNTSGNAANRPYRTSSSENDAIYLAWSVTPWHEVLGCGCCCRPSVTLNLSSGARPVEDCEAATSALFCISTEKCSGVMSAKNSKVTKGDTTYEPSQQPTTTYNTATENHHYVCVVPKNAQFPSRQSLPGDYVRPSAAVQIGDPVHAGQRQQYVVQSPAPSYVSHPFESVLVQTAAATHAGPNACRTGRGWGGSSAWPLHSSSTYSPSVVSDLPIVPLSAWPVPAALVCEDGVSLPERVMEGDSHDNLDDVSCSATCYYCIGGTCKRKETVLPPVYLGNQKNLVYTSRECRRQHLLRRRLHNQGRTDPHSRAVCQHSAQLSPAKLYKEGVHRRESATLLLTAPSPAAAETAIAVAFDADAADALELMAAAAASPSSGPLQLPFRSPTDSWLLSYAEGAPPALIPTTPAQGSAHGAVGACCSPLRTAILLLGDHDSESIGGSCWSLYDSAKPFRQEHLGEIEVCRTPPTSDSRCDSIESPSSSSGGGNVSGSETCSTCRSSGNNVLLDARTVHERRGQDNLSRRHTPKLLSCNIDADNVTPDFSSVAADPSAMSGGVKLAPSGEHAAETPVYYTAGCGDAYLHARSLSTASTVTLFTNNASASNVVHRAPPKAERLQVEGTQHQQQQELRQLYAAEHQGHDEAGQLQNRSQLYLRQATEWSQSGTVLKALAKERARPITKSKDAHPTEAVNGKGLNLEAAAEGARPQISGPIAGTHLTHHTRSEPVGDGRCQSPARRKPSGVAAKAVRTLFSLKTRTAEVLPSCSKVFLESTLHSPYCEPAFPDSVRKLSVTGTVEAASIAATALPVGRTAVQDAGAAANGPLYDPHQRLCKRQANCQKDGRNARLADSDDLDIASCKSSEVFSGKAVARREQKEARKSVAAEEERLQLPQACVVANATDLSVPATPSPPRHQGSNQDGLCSYIGSGLSSITRADFSHWSRRSSRGSDTCTSTQSGLLSYWTSRSSSTRCSPLNRSRSKSLAASDNSKDATWPTSTATLLHKCVGDLPSSTPCKLSSLEHAERRQLSGDGAPYSVPPHDSPDNFVDAAAADGSSDVQTSEAPALAGCSTEPAYGAAAALSSRSPSPAPAAAGRFTAALPDLAFVGEPKAVATIRPESEVHDEDKVATLSALPHANVALEQAENDIQLQSLGSPPWLFSPSAAAESFSGPPVFAAEADAAVAAASSGATPCPETPVANLTSSSAVAASMSETCSAQVSSYLAVKTASTLHHSTAATPQHFDTTSISAAEGTKEANSVKMQEVAGAAAPRESCLPQTITLSISGLPSDAMQKVDVAVTEPSRFAKEGQALLSSRPQALENRQKSGTHTGSRAVAAGAESSTSPPTGNETVLKHHGTLPALCDKAVQSRLFYQLARDLQPDDQGPRMLPLQHLQKDEQPQQQERRRAQLQPLSQQLGASAMKTFYGEPHLDRQCLCANHLSPLPISAEGGPLAKTDEGLGSSGGEFLGTNPDSDGRGSLTVAVPKNQMKPVFAADATLTSYYTKGSAGMVGHSSEWTMSAGDLATISLISQSQVDEVSPNETRVTLTHPDNNKDIIGLPDGEALYAPRSSGSPRTAYKCTTSPVPALNAINMSLKSTVTPRAATGQSSIQSAAGRKSLQQHVPLPRSSSANSVAFQLGATALSAVVPIRHSMTGWAEKQRIQQQVPEGELQTRRDFSFSNWPCNSGQAAQTFCTEFPCMTSKVSATSSVSASKQQAAAASHTRLAPVAPERPAARGATHVEAGGKHRREEVDSSGQDGQGSEDTPGRRNLPNQNARSTLEAVGVESLSGRPTSAAQWQSANDCKTAPAVRGVGKVAAEMDTLRTQYRHGGAAGAPAAGLLGEAAAARGVVAPATHSAQCALSIAGCLDSATANRAAGDDAGEQPRAQSNISEVEPREKERLMTMSDNRWIALRRSGLFRLGDKGRASIKSRIAKQLRLCPDLRRAAAAIGGGGVRCATTKQLYQLAELCGFDDVLPPQFRRQRFGPERHGTNLAAQGKSSAVAGGAPNANAAPEETQRCRAEETSGSSSTVTYPSAQGGVASQGFLTVNGSCSAVEPVTPLGTSPGIGNIHLLPRCDSTVDCNESVKPSSSHIYAYQAHVVERADRSFRKQLTVSAEKRQQAPELQPQSRKPPADHTETNIPRRRRQTGAQGLSEAMPVTRVVEQNPVGWRSLVSHQQLQQATEHDLQHQLQPLDRGLHHLHMQHLLQSHQQHSYQQVSPDAQEEVNHQLRGQPLHERHLQQEHWQRRESENDRLRLPMLSHAAAEPVRVCEPCSEVSAVEAGASEHQVKQQSFYAKTQQEGLPQTSGQELHLRQQSQCQWLQQGHLLHNQSILGSAHCRNKRQQLPSEHQRPHTTQQAAQQQHEQQIFCEHRHLYPQTGASSATNVGAVTEAAELPTSQESEYSTGCTVQLVGVQGVAPSAATVTTAIPLVPACKSSYPAFNAGSRYRCSIGGTHTSKNANSSNGNSAVKDTTSAAKPVYQPVESGLFSKLDSGSIPVQPCLFQRRPRRHGEQQVQDGQQHPAHQWPPGSASCFAEEWGSQADSSPEARIDVAVVADCIAATAVHSVRSPAGVIPGDRIFNRAVPGAAADIVAHRLPHQVEALAFDEGALPAVVHPNLKPPEYIRHHCAPRLPILQLAQISTPPTSSSQLLEDNGTGTAFACGLSSTTTSGSYFTEDARAMTRQEVSSMEDFSLAGRRATQSPLEVKVPLLHSAGHFSERAGPAAEAAAENCGSPFLVEKTRRRKRNAQIHAMQQSRSSEARLPEKRYRAEVAGAAALQNNSSPRTVSSNRIEPQPPSPAVVCDSAETKQLQQPYGSSLADSSHEVYQSPGLLQDYQHKELHGKIATLSPQKLQLREPLQWLQLAAKQKQEGLLEQQHIIQQQSWKNGLLSGPCRDSLPSENVSRDTCVSTDSEQLQRSHLKTARSETDVQRPHSYETAFWTEFFCGGERSTPTAKLQLSGS